MKKIYFLFILSITGLSTIVAQSFIYPKGQHLNVIVQDTSVEGYEINIETAVPEPITYSWIRITNTLPAAWDYSLCDYTTCYISIPNSATMSPISLSEAQNGTKGFFTLSVFTGANYGTGELSFYVYDSNDFNRGDTVSMIINNPNTTGIKENSATSLVNFFPNPVQENITFKNESSENIKIEIYSVVGALVIQDLSSANRTHSLNLSKLDKGIYFVTLIDNDGIKKTERLILR